MKKWFALAVVAVLTILVVATVVSAQAPQPQSTPQPGTGYGRGGMTGGMMGQGMAAGMASRVGGMVGMGRGASDDGILHDSIVASLAAKLGLTAGDVQARLDKGETMWQIASSKGLTTEQFSAWMLEARSAAIDAAVKAGTLTQAQADWMKQRSQNMPMFQNGFDPDDCPMQNGAAGTARGGMMGRGRWAQPSTTTP